MASSSTHRVVLGAFEHHVEIWDVNDRSLVGACSTVFDFGGCRLALSDERNVLLAAAYTRFGLVAYRPESGERLWQRTDLKKIQQLTLGADGTRVFCERDGSPCEVVDVATGETVERLRDTQSVFESAWDAVRFRDRSRPAIETLDGRPVRRVPRLTFGVLDVAFAPERCVVSESGGPVRCLSISSDDEMWRYEPAPGAHVLRMAYRRDDDSVLAVEWPFQSGGPRSLLSFSAANGVLRSRHEIAGRDHAFCAHGRCLVTSTRQVLISDGAAVLHELRRDTA